MEEGGKRKEERGGGRRTIIAILLVVTELQYNCNCQYWLSSIVHTMTSLL